MQDKPYIALGLMSGTSLDGIDAAFIETNGKDILSFGPSLCLPYPDRSLLQDTIKSALVWGFEGPRPEIFSRAQDYLDRAHIRAVNRICTVHPDWGQRLDVIGYHGQTVLHYPAQDGFMGQSVQLGNGAALAAEFGVPCVYDFRSADIAANGQGAPLAPIYHEALCRSSMFFGRVAVVNIGGVSNVTFVAPDTDLRASDCGPGNGPLDSWVEHHSGKAYDKDGTLSMAGNVRQDLVDNWFKRDFFSRPMPRSADRYDFDVLDELRGVSLTNGAASLAAFCAQAIARDVKGFAPDTVIICGGGRHNKAIMQMLSAHIDAEILTSENVAWDGDGLEAQAFAFLAVRSLRRFPISFKGTTGVAQDMSGGVVALP
ncbi:MAG: anhydro-N-acetylmuramic acid kinase [Litorimonas sp.]